MIAVVARTYEELGRWLCRRGRHAPLEWLPASQKPVPITNQPIEMLKAVGFLDTIAKWNGWCPRCGRAVMWADRKPSELPKQ